MQSLTKALCTGFLSLAITSFATPSSALSVEEVPNPRQENAGWVTDMTNILNDSTEAELNRLISELEDKNGTEIAVVTVPETTPASSPKEFTTALFNHWGIGKAEQDNGVLFLISEGDRRVEIETGYGVEAILPDADVGNIIEQKITPQFKKGNFDAGTLAGTQALVQVFQGKAEETGGASLIGYGLGVLLGCGALLGAFVWLRSSNEGSANGGGGDDYGGGSSTSGSSTSGGYSGGSSSGGGFGGGSSGGGGAGSGF